MDLDAVLRRYRELQRYVGWEPDNARLIRGLADRVRPHLPAIIDDFYAEVMRHADVRRVITGGDEQIARLKSTLRGWLEELFSGDYDADYVARRWRVGWRHVEIGLEQVYTNAALSRLRRGLLGIFERSPDWPEKLAPAWRALQQLIDLDLAIIEDAYQAEHRLRQQESERRNVELAAARGALAFRNLVEVTSCMIFVLRADRRIAYINPFAEQLTGYLSNEVRDRDCFELFTPEAVRGEVTTKFEQAMTTNPTHDYESPIVCRDGAQRSIVWNARRVEDFEGEPGLLAVGLDITELKETQRQALQAERLAAIGQMMAGLAHESRNALQRSMACLEMLAMEVEDRPEALELVGRVQKAQDHLHRLYEEVRGYAAPIQLQRQTCDLAQIWRDTWAHLEHLLRANPVTLREELEGSEPRAEVDRFALGQVFRNVFENAIDACREGGRITVAVARTALHGRPAIRISIRDTGPGLNAEQRRNIFEPFFTTKTKGTGLGMAIAKRIIEAHGGRIEVGPPTAPGAEIILTLPRDGA